MVQTDTERFYEIPETLLYPAHFESRSYVGAGVNEPKSFLDETAKNEDFLEQPF